MKTIPISVLLLMLCHTIQAGNISVNRSPDDQMRLLHEHLTHIEKRLGAIEDTLKIKHKDWFPQKATELMSWIRVEDERLHTKQGKALNSEYLTLGEKTHDLMVLLDEVGMNDLFYRFAKTLHALEDVKTRLAEQVGRDNGRKSQVIRRGSKTFKRHRPVSHL